jgi:hypothetical protein
VSRKARWLAAGGALVMALTLAFGISLTQASAATATNARFYVTLYGFVDNSPPSAIISNPVIHKKAGGTGTFKDPITFATDKREEKPGTIVYYAYLRKYFIMEDTCSECTRDWNGNNGDNPVPPRNGHRWRIDLWAGGDKRSLHGADKAALLACEDKLTQDKGGTVTLHPSSNLPVDLAPIYNVNTRKCQTPH